MASRPDHRCAPFGWLETFGGGMSEVRSEVARISGFAETLWRGQFPPARGYRVKSAVTDDGLELGVSRGDFTAVATLQAEWEEGVRVRMYGGAACPSVTHAEAEAARFVPRATAVGATIGLCVFLTSCWLVIGQQEPVYPLSGMLMVALLMFSLVTGGALGGRLGEHLAARHVARARRLAADDQELQDDLERWTGVSRALAHQRAALTGLHRRQPFRREA